MPRFIALFRGINVGRAKRVAMADLRAQLASLGYSDIATLLNSGNAVFSTAGGSAVEHASRIQTTVAGNLGVTAHVIVLSAPEFAAAVAENPLCATAVDSSRLLVAFAQQAAILQPLAEFSSMDWSPDALAVGRHAAYVWCADGILKSRLLKSVESKLGGLVTTRNWATVEKIAALLGPATK